jgi:signal transduction histidine kinase
MVTGQSPPASESDVPLVIPLMPATSAHRGAAICVAATVFLAFAAIAPFASITLGRIDVFVPVLQTVLSVVDLLTATLLLGQYSVQPLRGLLAVATAYLFSGSFAFLQTLSFPGGYAPNGVLGDGYNTPAWFFVLWHTTFPLGILAYALLKAKAPSDSSAPSIRTGIVATIAAVLLAVTVLTWIVTAWVDYLPSFYTGSVTLQTRFGNQINIALWLLCAVTLAVLFSRRRTILDMWLMVTLVAWMPNFLVAAVASSVRFSLGWYAARGFALVASCILLSILLIEMMVLYSRLASALILQRRERANQLMSIDAATSAIAHEIRSPLASITLNAAVALNQLAARPPDLEEMDAVLKDIEQASLRVDSIITSVRNLVIKKSSDHAGMQIETVANQVLRLLRHDLQVSQITVLTKFAGHAHAIVGDRTQLQQVVLNIIKNAIEAMMSAPADQRKLTVSTRIEEPWVVLSVQDTGSGIPERANIFDAFFTTKPDGMGLGLAICRTIIDRHGGTLVLVATGDQGTELEVRLPIASSPSRLLQASVSP